MIPESSQQEEEFLVDEPLEAGRHRPPSRRDLRTSSGLFVFARLPENRKKILIWSFIITVVVAAIIVIAVSVSTAHKPDDSHSPPPAPPLPSDPLERANALMTMYPLIDGHNDLPWALRALVRDAVSQYDLTVRQNRTETDIPRLRQGHVGGQFWSVYVPCAVPVNGSMTPVQSAVRATMEQIDVVVRMTQTYPQAFQLALSSADIESAFGAGRVASLIGVEGGHSIDSSLGALRQFYRLGARYMTLTHTCNTPWAGSCAGAPLSPNGLTAFGQQVVLEMNRLGMLVDISHVAHDTMRSVLNVTRAPVIFSHSSAYGLCNNPRNVPDDVLLLLRQNGGVVMVNFFNQFINCTSPSSATAAQVADHVDYIRNASGIDHIGIGADFDGVGGQLPPDLKDVSMYPNLFAELIRRHYSDEDIAKVLGGNLLRAFRQAEAVAASLQLSEIPNETIIDYAFNNSCRTPLYGF